MRDLHEYYDQLNDFERAWVDAQFSIMFHSKPRPLLRGDDEAELAVDGVARWVIESRAK